VTPPRNAKDGATGTRIADYTLERQIGHGGMAVVYLARDMRLDRPVALKLLAPELAGNPQFRARFIRESHIAAAIDHPNIVPIYEAGEYEDQLYIAMRFVDGRDLGTVLAQEGPLPIGRANRIFSQVAAALDVAHDHELVHRDVKPANILLTKGSPSDPDHVYLTDFGLTKRSLSLSGFTSVGNFVGSIDYVSPEQIAGRPVDGRADVYALGCVIFEALTGVPPFQRDNDLGVLWAHFSDPPLPFAPYRSDLPPEVGQVLASALAKAPEERYATCTEVVVAIRDVVSAAAMGADVRVRLPTTTSPMTQEAPRPPVRRSADVAAGQAFAAGRPPDVAPAGTERPQPPASVEEPQAPPREPRSRRPGWSRRTKVWIASVVALVLVAGAVGAFLATRGGGTAPPKTFAGSSVTPLAFSYPANWSVRPHTTVFTLLSPAVDDMEPVFASDDWALADRLIHGHPGSATGIYSGTNEALDVGASSQGLQETFRFLLPGAPTYSGPAQPTTVGGAKAAKLAGVTRGPGGDELQFRTYVVARTGADAYLMFFCDPKHCDDKAFDRTLASVRVAS
jgi:serine/threonine protein kinase